MPGPADFLKLESTGEKPEGHKTLPQLPLPVNKKVQQNNAANCLKLPEVVRHKIE